MAPQCGDPSRPFLLAVWCFSITEFPALVPILVYAFYLIPWIWELCLLFPIQTSLYLQDTIIRIFNWFHQSGDEACLTLQDDIDRPLLHLKNLFVESWDITYIMEIRTTKLLPSPNLLSILQPE